MNLRLDPAVRAAVESDAKSSGRSATLVIEDALRKKYRLGKVETK